MGLFVLLRNGAMEAA